MKKQHFLIFIFCVLFLSFPNITLAKTLRVVNFSADIPCITSLDQSFDPDSYSVITQIFDSLVHIDLDGNMVPGLATSWKLIDETTYEFTLREGVKFHNGENFNAEAVKFTYEKIIDPAMKAGNAWILGTIKAVEIVDPYKVRIKLVHPDGMFLFRLSMFGAIAPPKYIQKAGLEEFKKTPVGTGPFKFVEWKKGQEIVLEKNPDYWMEGVPTIDKLVFKIIPEELSVDVLKSGMVDVLTNVHPNSISRIEADPKLKTQKRLVLQGFWVMLKNKGPLADVRVRKAINYALNKENLIKVQGGGFGVPLASLGKDGEIGKNTTLKPYPYDPEMAKSLLKEAGYPGGFMLKGISIKQGADLSKAIVEDLAKIGIIVKMEIVSRPEWARRVIVGKIQGIPYDGDMAINLVDNPIMNLAFHAGLFLASPSPWSLASDKEFDKKYQEALFTATFDQHVEALKSLDKYIHDNAMMLFTFQPERIFAMRQDISIPGIGINGHVDYFVFSQAE